MKTSAISILSFLLLAACDHGAYDLGYNQAGARVIGRETCNIDTTKDYWLLDFGYIPGQPQYGDTIVFHGKTYFNAVKTLELDSQFRVPDKKIVLGFNISKEPVITQGCDVGSPVTYPLKVITIVKQLD